MKTISNTKLYDHQIEDVQFLLDTHCAFNTSTPGTGKTLSTLETFHQRNDGKMLVICPKTIMQAAWGADIEQYYPDTKYEVFNRKYVKNKNYIRDLFWMNDIVIINFEAAGLILENAPLEDYNTLIVDEFTAVKNRQTQRSKNILKLSENFKYRILLSGTPTPNSILDIWHPTLIVDRGLRLGTNFFQFRNTVCVPSERGTFQKFTEWKDIPEAADVVAHTLRSINIRHCLEEVIDMPERIYRTMAIDMSDKVHKFYDEMARYALLTIQEHDITAVNKAILGNKLLQIASGSVYDALGNAVLIHDEKYHLIAELVREREHSLVFYIWTHQMEVLGDILNKLDISYAIINGNTADKQRARIVEDYQAGQYQTLLVQPAAAAHGLTLTRSTASIWCSPTFNLEHFSQANHRDYRIGQTKRSEVIMIEYKNTIERYVYEKLQNKQNALDDLLQILKS